MTKIMVSQRNIHSCVDDDWHLKSVSGVGSSTAAYMYEQHMADRLSGSVDSCTGYDMMADA